MYFCLFFFFSLHRVASKKIHSDMCKTRLYIAIVSTLVYYSSLEKHYLLFPRIKHGRREGCCWGMFQISGHLPGKRR